MKRYFLLLLLPLVGVLFAYQTPSFNPQDEIAAAKSWYLGSSYANTVFLGYALQPDWNNAQVSKPRADRLLIEVPLIGGDQFQIAKRDASGQLNPAHKNGATRLVITKFGDNQYIPLLFHAFGTPAYIAQYGAQAADAVKPQQVPANFNGNLFYTRLDGEPFFGIAVENGKVKANMWPAVRNQVTPRGCSVIETICMGYGENVLCIHYVLCEVFDGPGVFTLSPGQMDGTWWGNNGPVTNCLDCVGGGFFPVLCPDGSVMSENGGCPPVVPEPDGPCKLTNTYVLERGPFVRENFVSGIVPFPWDADTEIAAILRNCQEGFADFEMTIIEQSGSVTLSDSKVIVIDKTNYVSSKSWGIKTKNYAQFIFEVTFMGVKYSSIANADNVTFFNLKYK